MRSFNVKPCGFFRTLILVIKQGVIFMTAGAGFVKVMELIFNDYFGVLIVLLINLSIQILKKYEILKTPLLKIVSAFIFGFLYTIIYYLIRIGVSTGDFSGFFANSEMWTMILLSPPCSVFMFELFEKVSNQKILSNKMATEIFNEVYISTKNKTLSSLVAYVFIGWDEYGGLDKIKQALSGIVSVKDFDVICSHIDSILKKYFNFEEDCESDGVAEDESAQFEFADEPNDEKSEE